jgi:predicted small lipoprotein YifL
MNKKILSLLAAILIAGGLMFTLAACEKEGPMEKAGEKIDQAAEEVQEEARQAKENVEDAAKK